MPAQGWLSNLSRHTVRWREGCFFVLSTLAGSRFSSEQSPRLPKVGCRACRDTQSAALVPERSEWEWGGLGRCLA
jgi:hypothetical protein